MAHCEYFRRRKFWKTYVFYQKSACFEKIEDLILLKCIVMHEMTKTVENMTAFRQFSEVIHIPKIRSLWWYNCQSATLGRISRGCTAPPLFSFAKRFGPGKSKSLCRGAGWGQSTKLDVIRVSADEHVNAIMTSENGGRVRLIHQWLNWGESGNAPLLNWSFYVPALNCLKYPEWRFSNFLYSLFVSSGGGSPSRIRHRSQTFCEGGGELHAN